MSKEAIVAPYGPFLSLLRHGTFQTPDDGWGASIIAAHVARNNDTIAAVARNVLAGRDASYDNREGIDTNQLASYAASHHDLAGELERSVERLATAYDDLDEVTGATTVAVVIADNGVVVVDAPMAIARLIEGNATFHLAAHFAQLQALSS